MDDLEIDGGRPRESLMGPARIGAAEKGGVCRPALAGLDREGCDPLVRRCGEAGCAVPAGQGGSVFARRAGRNPGLARTMTCTVAGVGGGRDSPARSE